MVHIREYKETDLPEMIDIWNDIISDGIAFPQTELLDSKSAFVFFSEQTYTGVLELEKEILGLYILHPNNIGRCGHIANTSYAVKKGNRGKHIGEKLVKHSLETAKEFSFRILQFNAVTASNTAALSLYKKLGFTRLGIIPGGFYTINNQFIDIVPHYKELV